MVKKNRFIIGVLAFILILEVIERLIDFVFGDGSGFVNAYNFSFLVIGSQLILFIIILIFIYGAIFGKDNNHGGGKLPHSIMYSFVFLVFFWLLCGLDLLIGAIYPFISPEYGAKNLQMAIKEEKGERMEKFRRAVHPYITYENTPGYKKKGISQHNEKGYRMTHDIKKKKSKKVVRILVTGGSTTYGSGVDSPEDAWPQLLEEMLNDSLSQIGREKWYVQVINGGIPWGTSAELLNHYIYRDRYLNPDIVILHTGGNDGGPLHFSDYDPEYTHWRNFVSKGKNGIRNGELCLLESNIVKLFYSFWFSKMKYSTSRVYVNTKNTRRLSLEKALNNVKENNPIGYRRNLSLLIRNIKDDGVLPVFFNFYKVGGGIFTSKGKSALKEADRVNNYGVLHEAKQIAFKKNKSVAKKVCKKLDAPYHFIPQGNIPIEYFVDHCHLNRKGQVFKAKFLKNKIFDKVMQGVKDF